MLAVSDALGKASHAATWHAVYTRHQHEKNVARILAIKGFEALLPLYEVRRRWQDRVKLLSMPLFPCYVFLKGGLERYLDVLATPGIHAFVLCAGRPAAIANMEIEAIERALERGARLEPHSFLQSGECVRVKSGPLGGINGILVRKKGLYRLVLSVAILGKSAAVEVDGALVERLPGPPPSRDGSGYEANSGQAARSIAGSMA